MNMKSWIKLILKLFLIYLMSKHWFIAHLIKKHTSGKILGLDVGCGKDNWMEFKKCKMLGIDIKKNDKIDVQTDLENKLPFKDECFDVVIAINSLNYIQNGRQILQEINRIMKDNAVLVCVVDNERSKNFPNIWEQNYLNRVLQVTGFRSVLSNSLKDYFYVKWFNRTSVYAFAVAKKIKQEKEQYKEKCFRCGKPLGKNFKKIPNSNKSQHLECQKNDSKEWAKSYNIETTHPDR